MAEYSAPQSLVSPTGTINFNTGTGDEYRILAGLKGLDQSPIRAPSEDASQTDGGSDYDYLRGPRHIIVPGLMIVRSATSDSGIVTARTAMENALVTALDGILATTGTYSITPTGGSTKTLTVRCEIPIDEFQPWQAAYPLFKTFTFGLYASNPTFA